LINPAVLTVTDRHTKRMTPTKSVPLASVPCCCCCYY